MKRFAALALVLASAVALAQTATTSATLAWTAPTANTDGSAISGALTYNVYEGPKAGPFTKVASGLSGGTTTLTSLTAGPCFAVTTVEAASESALSNTVCVLEPDGPSSLTVTLTVTVH